MVIHTPRLCGEPIFVGGSSSAADDAAEKKRKEINVIECRPVIRDELYVQYLNAGSVRGDSNPTRELPAAELNNDQQAKEASEHKVDALREERATPEGAEATNADSAHIASDEQSSSDKKATPERPAAAVGNAETKGAPQVEEFVLGSYILAYDRHTGEMTVNPDPEEVVKDELLDAAQLQDVNENTELSQKEAETMQALLVEFRRSLEEMMKNVGTTLQDTKDDVKDVHDNIKKVQDAYEAATTGVSGPSGESGNEGQPARQQKGDTQARFMRTGAHNHREIVEKYLKGQIGGLIPGKKSREQQRKEAAPLHRQRAPKQPKMGTPQFRNLKRAFEQKWDDDASDNARSEGKSGEDNVKNVAAPDAGPRGHDEL